MTSDARTTLAAAGRRYRRTETAHDNARRELLGSIVDALRSGVGPAEVARLSTLADRQVRRIARENGIEPAPPGMKPRRRDNDA